MHQIGRHNTGKKIGRLLPALLAALCLLQPAMAQPVQGDSLRNARKIFFVQKIDLQLSSKVDFSQKAIRRQYQQRPYEPALRKEIGKSILSGLASKGYYFARIDSSALEADSLERTVRLYYEIHPGSQAQLAEIRIVNFDSLQEADRKALEERFRDYLPQTYTEDLSKALLRSVIDYYENHGRPLAKIYTEGVYFEESEKTVWPLRLDVRIEPGDSVSIDYLRFPAGKEHLSGYLQRLLRFSPGQLYRQERIRKYVKILGRQEFVKRADAPLLSKDKEGRYFLDVPFEEAPSTSLDGIIGYIPPPANDPEASGYFTGLINIGVRNLFGGGRKLHIFWQKQDQFSDEFLLSYKEPFTGGLPFHTLVGMSRLVRDTTFIDWKYNLSFELPLNENLSAFVDFSTRNVAPDTLASRRLRLPRTESFTTETGIRWDVRDQILNPRKGAFLKIAFSLSTQKNIGPAYLIAEDSLKKKVTLQRMRADLGVFVPTFKRQLIANQVHLEFIENKGEILRSPDQVWFGGATSVRGFREAQFFGRRVAWMNSEYRFLLGPQARFFFFTDNAWFSREFPDSIDKWLTSYGLGLQFPGPLGVVQVDFGMEKGAPFREGKLHFRIINEF